MINECQEFFGVGRGLNSEVIVKYSVGYYHCLSNWVQVSEEIKYIPPHTHTHGNLSRHHITDSH